MEPAKSVKNKRQMLPLELYPECEKMGRIRDKSQVIGEFLHWAGSKGMFLADYDDEDFMQPIRKNTEDILAEFFNIDLKKVEQEKRTILKSLNP